MSPPLPRRLSLLVVRDTTPPRGLRADERPNYVGEIGGTVLLLERRRADCAYLASCEEEWIAEHGSAQARCPMVCTHHAPREDAAADVSYGNTLAGRMGR